MADPLAPTYADLITELQAARTELKEIKDTAAAKIKQVKEAAATEVKEVKDAAAAEIKQVNATAAADKTAHTHNLVDTYSKEIPRMCEAAQQNGEKLMAENRALKKKLEGVAASTVKEELNDGAPGSATTVEDDGADLDLDLLDLLRRVEMAWLLSGSGGWASRGPRGWVKGGGRAISDEELRKFEE
ncbi:hypothetical protein LTR56_000476 [Elasticomyces elasticus]|nr:hypothetical protein LTR22_014204 [Elasticomyces elasticus]KAK3660718.1 hypothetical protein LTR56_000476 [Elasticomyces elasticus]KAK4922864.1 hypothetical protein LTR49_009871 [Elasticomyces elasticus]KAK5759760.1 hypothetical protein LTS12_010100 [Elasticomyces elasticus]